METLITTVTDGQKKQVKRFAEDAVDRAIAEGLLDKDSIQKLIENGDKLQSRIVTAVRELSVSNQFADKKVSSSYVYSNGYRDTTSSSSRARWVCITAASRFAGRAR